MDTSERSEEKRLQALRNLNILNTPCEKKFDDLTQIAATLLSAPIALISLVDETHQWFKSCIGLAAKETSREVSFCAHAIAQKDLDSVFVVEDATKDPLFANNPLVTGEPHIRFYAGAPLVTSDGHPIGSLCVIDKKPRQPTAEQLETLRILARSAAAQMELHKASEALAESEESARHIIDTALDAVITVDSGLHVTGWNPKATEMFGLGEAMVLGQPIEQVVLSDSESRGRLRLLFGLDEMTCAARQMEMTLQRSGGEMFPVEISVAHWNGHSGRMSSVFIRDVSIRKLAEFERLEAETRDVVIYAMARLVESRDPETGAHIERVQSYCQAIAEQLAKEGPYKNLCDPEFVHLMYTTSPLHDIGKVGIPDDILLKPGRLSDREFEIMKQHAAIGAETLEAAMVKFPNTRFLRMARNIAATHHERFDGSGYPKKLVGETIPLCGRIVALADVYDALTSRRVYKSSFTHDVARTIIYKESGKHFDPAIVEAFRAIEGTFESIYKLYCDINAKAA